MNDIAPACIYSCAQFQVRGFGKLVFWLSDCDKLIDSALPGMCVPSYLQRRLNTH